MKVENTELEYTEADQISMDYFMGGLGEDFSQFAQRIWSKCKEYSDTDGKGNDGKSSLEEVYKEDPINLWELKKRAMRMRFMKECGNLDLPNEYLDYRSIKQCGKKECEWPESFSDSEVIALKERMGEEYKTADQKEIEYEEKLNLEAQSMDNKIQSNVNRLLTKFDEETVAILYPQGKKFLSIS